MSIEQQTIGNWGELKGKVKQRWGQLTDDEVQVVEGNYDQLLGLIQRKSGETREQIECALNELNGGTSSTVDSIRHAVTQAGEAVRGAAFEAGLQTQERYKEVQEMVHERPAQAIAVAFGAGVAAGLLLGIALHTPRSRMRTWHDGLTANEFGRKLRKRAESILPESISARLGI